jgi:predicted dehydrogenase
MSDPSTPAAGKPVNVAVIGLGLMGVTHLRAYLANPLARVVAVCDTFRVPENGILKGMAGNVQDSGDIDLGPDVKVFQRPEDLLADPEVRLVDICTPTPLHAEQVIAALKAGKDVICEKPLARSSAAAREILAVAGDSPGFLMPAMCMRFWPGWNWLKQVVAEQTHGKVLAAGFTRVSAMPSWSSQGTYASGADTGGALFDMHIHDADFINHLFGRPAGVFSTGVPGADGSINHVMTQYVYPDGPVVHAEGGWLRAKGFNMAYTLLCERATIDFDLERGADALKVTENGGTPEVKPLEAGDGYTRELQYILECVSQRRAPQVVTALDGMTALEICEAEEQSVRSGQHVNLCKPPL